MPPTLWLSVSDSPGTVYLALETFLETINISSQALLKELHRFTTAMQLHVLMVAQGQNVAVCEQSLKSMAWKTISIPREVGLSAEDH